MSVPMGHGHFKKPQVDNEEEDPVIAMITRTGCLTPHYALQECIYDKKDWRRCQKEVIEFRTCMQEGAKKNKAKNS